MELHEVPPPTKSFRYLRADPLLWEQELDVRPEFAEAVERACGNRAGRVYWRARMIICMRWSWRIRARASVHGHGLGFWDRFEPRPPEHEIDQDLLVFCMWVAEIGRISIRLTSPKSLNWRA